VPARIVVFVGTMPRGSEAASAREAPIPAQPEPSRSVPAPPLRGRQAECRQLAGLVEDVRRGESRVLVMSGEAGIGKSALLDFLVAGAAGCRVVRAAGVQAETELALAGLHQLCTPLRNRLDRLPEPQRAALGITFGLRAGPAPDPLLLRLAVLGLLIEGAAEQPLVCVVDDAQWLDPTSVQALAFAGWWGSPSGWCSRFATRPGPRPWPVCRDCRSAASVARTRESCSPRRSRGGWTSGCATASSPRREATRSPCWNCPRD
jgi:hypothetical protein